MGARPALATALALVLLWLCLFPGRVLAVEPVASPIVISGALAPTRPGLLHEVEARRVREGWVLTEVAPPDTVLIAVAGCEYLGSGALIVIDHTLYPARVVDCETQHDAGTLASRGLAADVDGPAELAHRQVLILLEVGSRHERE